MIEDGSKDGKEEPQKDEKEEKKHHGKKETEEEKRHKERMSKEKKAEERKKRVEEHRRDEEEDKKRAKFDRFEGVKPYNAARNYIHDQDGTPKETREEVASATVHGPGDQYKGAKWSVNRD